MSKRILIISQNFYPEIGSAANRMKNIYQLLLANGYHVKVITTEPAYPNKNIYEDERFWNDDFINVDDNIYRTSVKTRKYSRSIMNRLFYYLEITVKMLLFILRDRSKYDIVYVTSPAIFIGFVGLIAKYRYKSRLLLEIRDLWPESLKGVGVLDSPLIITIFSRLEKLLYIKADEIIVNSKGFIKHICKHSMIPREKVTFIPNGAIDEEVSKGSEKDEFKVIYAGNIGLAQDTELIKQLAKGLNEWNVAIDIIGYGMKATELSRFVKENKLTNVSFVKPKTRKECLTIISNYQVGIVTLSDKAVFETVLPGKVIDYMTCGVPIVASVSGISKQIIEKQNVGFVSQGQNVNEMLKNIIYLYENRNAQREMSNNGIRYVREHFMWENNIWKLINIIEDKERAKRTHPSSLKSKSLDKVESL